MLKSNLKGDVIMEFVVKNGNVKVGEIISLYMPDEDDYFEGEVRKHPTNGLYVTDGYCVVYLTDGMLAKYN